MKVTLDSKLKLHPLEIRKEKKFYIVEDKSVGEFYEMPEVCVIAINKISEGLNLGEIEQQLRAQFPQEDINLLEFAVQLLELRMVDEVDGNSIKAVDREPVKLGFNQISPKFALFFFNKPMKIIYVILFLINIILLILNPQLFPHYKDVFIFDVMFQNIITWVLVGGTLVLIHEFGHILAIRAHGLQTKLEVGHRLFFLVLETDLSLGWKLKAKERIFLYLSGLCFDNVILFIALMAQILFPNSHEIFINIMAFMVMDIVIRFIYQCCVYMKTDLYYVIENITGCHNLMENAKEYLRQAIKIKVKNSTTSIFDGEQKIVMIYGVLYFLGLILSMGLFAFYYIPQLIFIVFKIIPGLSDPITKYSFWDSILVCGQLVLTFGLLTFSVLKNRKMDL